MTEWVSLLSNITGLTDFTQPISPTAVYQYTPLADEIGWYIGSPALVVSNVGAYFLNITRKASLFIGIPRVESGNSKGLGVFQIHSRLTTLKYDFGPFSSEIPPTAQAYLYADTEDPFSAISQVINTTPVISGVEFYLSSWNGRKLSHTVAVENLYTVDVDLSISVVIVNSNPVPIGVSILFPRDILVNFDATPHVRVVALSTPIAPTSVLPHFYPPLSRPDKFNGKGIGGLSLRVDKRSGVSVNLVFRLKPYIL